VNLLIVTNYFEPDSGAAAVRLSRLARLLHQRGHTVTVLTTMPHYPEGRIASGYRGRFAVVEDRDGLRVVRTWLFTTTSSRIAVRLVSQLSAMLTAALRGLALPRPDVVLIESQPVFTSLAGVFLSRVKRAPYVLNASDIWPEYLLAAGVLRESHPLYRLFRWMVNFTQRGAAGIVGLYPHILETIAGRIGAGDNRRVIYNAVDLERFRPGMDSTAFRRAHDLDNARLVSFVGTFGTHIDFETMLGTAAHFSNRDDVRFVFIGTGGQREKLAARLGDLSNTVWIGWLDHEQMPVAWSAAHIAFWAVRDHELYRTILQSKVYEALASGVPVAIAVEGITTELVERSAAGLTVPFADSSALAAAIERLLDDSDFHRQCSQSARAYAEKHFDPQRTAEAYEELLLAAINHAERDTPG
jgi:colanic acid biosynthesis glycosyl transferase WcaI